MALNKVIFLMGVSGVGKSTIAASLSKKLSIPFFDGDDFHSKENILKMSRGVPLTDEDRNDWLHTLNNLAKKQAETNDCIIVCSALKQKYRTILSDGLEANIAWVLLSGEYNLIIDRMKHRSNHFMPSALLRSQLSILEIPTNALIVDINLPPSIIVEKIAAYVFEEPSQNVS
ncbi:MAG: gluconokinase [Ferruginibacter sp.]